MITSAGGHLVMTRTVASFPVTERRSADSSSAQGESVGTISASAARKLASRLSSGSADSSLCSSSIVSFRAIIIVTFANSTAKGFTSTPKNCRAVTKLKLPWLRRFFVWFSSLSSSRRSSRLSSR